MSESVITCWYRLTGEEIGFSHISDGYDEAAVAPIPRSEFQRHAWARQKWEGRKGYLRNGVVHEVKVPTFPMRWAKCFSDSGS